MTQNSEFIYDIFLSFSHEDIDRAKRIWQRMKHSGLKVYFSHESNRNKAGQSFLNDIQNALIKSRNFVLVCTPKAINSSWVEEEYQTFYNQCYMKEKKTRRLILLLDKDFDISTLPPFLRNLQVTHSDRQIISIVKDANIEFLRQQNSNLNKELELLQGEKSKLEIDLENYKKKGSDTIEGNKTQKIKTFSFSEGFKESSKQIESAKSEILILSNYIYDEKNKKILYGPEILESPERKAFFKMLKKKLVNQKRNGFRYIKIVQIENINCFEEAIKVDPIYYEDCKFLVGLSKSEPEFACLRISEVIFHNTFAIIDRSFLHLEFENAKLDNKQAFSPFIITIDNSNSEFIQTLTTVFKRIESNSILVTHIN